MDLDPTRIYSTPQNTSKNTIDDQLGQIFCIVQLDHKHSSLHSTLAPHEWFHCGRRQNCGHLIVELPSQSTKGPRLDRLLLDNPSYSGVERNRSSETVYPIPPRCSPMRTVRYPSGNLLSSNWSRRPNLSSIALLTIAWQLLFYIGESKVRDIAATVNRQIRSLGFPEGSGMGIFFAIGIPVDIPDQSVTFSFYFEANYLLPNNENFINDEFHSTFRGRSFNRSVAYDIIERKLEGAGYPGRPCLLRSICEAATSPVTYNGVVGDIIHLILTPSSSEDEDLPADLIEAEHAKDCINNYNECSISLLDFISSYRP